MNKVEKQAMRDGLLIQILEKVVTLDVKVDLLLEMSQESKLAKEVIKKKVTKEKK